MSSLDILLFGCIMACFDKDNKNKKVKTIGCVTITMLMALLIIGGLYE